MVQIDRKETGYTLWWHRTHNGYTVKELAKLMGFTNPTTIYKWENGTTLPTLENMVKLSDLYGEPINRLIYTRRGNK